MSEGVMEGGREGERYMIHLVATDFNPCHIWYFLLHSHVVYLV